METFNIFPDLPSIEETQHTMGEHAQPYTQWYSQERAPARHFDVYGAEPALPVDTRRLNPYPSHFGMATVPYSSPLWASENQRSNTWPPSYSTQAMRTEETTGWSMPAQNQSQLPFLQSYSDRGSIEGSNVRSLSWTPDSARFEKEEEYPLTPDGNRAPDCWQYQGESCGTYVQPGLYPSPAISHASHMSGSDLQSGIKLEDVQPYPDACSVDPFSDFDESQRYPWDPSERTRTISDDMVMETRTPELASTPSDEGVALDDTATELEDNDSASDYAPKPRPQPKSVKTAKIPKSGARNRPKMKTRSKPSRVSKRTPLKETVAAEAMIALGGKNTCPHCQQACPNKSALNKHITTIHTRPFTCTFRKYGCTATFGSKNEWKRHVSSQHLRLGIWRCDIGSCCPQPTGDENEELIFNDFNRKDLFTQHLRRMHAPPNSSSGDSKQAFNAQLDEITQRCLVDIRAPPPRSICGYCASDGQETIFEGASAWETRMEHVGRHLESGHGDHKVWVEDDGLRDWMVIEGLLDWDDSKGYWLTGPAYVNAKGR